MISVFVSVPVKEEDVTLREAEQLFIDHTGVTKAEFSKQIKRPLDISPERRV
jgi:hypothetical protein